MTTTELSNEEVEKSRKFGRTFLQMMPAEEVLAHYSAEKRMQGLSPEDVFKNYSPEQIKAYLKGLEPKA